MNNLERRFGWLSFPGIIRYYALMHVLVFVLQIINPNMGQLLDFDREKILAGEVWRLFTFYFAASRFGGMSPFTLIFLFFIVNFMFMVGDGLESEWGAFKTSLFVYFGMLSLLLWNLLFVTIPLSGLTLYSSVFFAFATLYPKMEVRLMLIIPIQVRFIAIIMAGGLLLQCLGWPLLFLFYLVATLNYFLWAGIPALRGKARKVQSAQRRSKFKAASMPETAAFHTCVVCGRTEISNPELEFRIATDGKEYCTDHLPASETVKENP